MFNNLFPPVKSGSSHFTVMLAKKTSRAIGHMPACSSSITPEAMAQYNVGFGVLALPGVAQPVPNYPAGAEPGMIKNDFEWAANNRAAILEEWSTRYDNKSEPKT